MVKAGDRVEMTGIMRDEPSPIPIGTRGTVTETNMLAPRKRPVALGRHTLPHSGRSVQSGCAKGLLDSADYSCSIRSQLQV